MRKEDARDCGTPRVWLAGLYGTGLRPWRLIIAGRRVRVLGWILANKTPHVSNDATQDPQVACERLGRFKVRSLLATPLLDSNGEVIGFFEVLNKKGDGAFTPVDQRNLLAVAQVASVSVQKALAYRKVRQTEKKLHSLSGQLLASQDEERSRI